MSFTPFDELGGSPILDLAVDHSRGVRTALINWSDIDSLAEYLFTSNLGVSRELPGFPFLRARSMHVEPFIRDRQKIKSPDSSNNDYDSLNAYDYARVRIEYETPSYDPNQVDDPVLLLTHRWSIGGEILSISSAGLQWKGGDNVSEDVSAGIVIPIEEHQIIWPRVQNPPFSVMRDRIGSVNNSSLTFSTGTIAPETFLFLGAELRRDVLSTGALAWEVVYRFSERRVPLAEDDTLGGDSGADPISIGGWNHFFRSENDELEPRVVGEKAGFYRLEIRPDSGSDGEPLYGLKSHSELFQEAS